MAGNGRGKVLRTSSNKYDKGLSVLEQYDLVSESTCRGRGSLLCQTDQGLKMIKPYTGSVKRLEKINEILEHLKCSGHENVDRVLRNKEGQLLTVDSEGYAYLVKDWWDVRECEVRLEGDVLLSMELMAQMHKDMFLLYDGVCEQENLLELYRKHNQQMKKIRTYIRDRKQKSIFEYELLERIGEYLELGTRVVKWMEALEYEKIRQRDLDMGSVCHGMCNQHNFLLAGDKAALVNFDHFFYGNHTADVAQFLRKVMEKHNWDIELGQKMIAAYESICPMSLEERKLLAIRMSYPEKFWKIANYYYNNNKAFLPEKNMDKLQVLIEQKDKWMSFLEVVFGKELRDLGDFKTRRKP